MRGMKLAEWFLRPFLPPGLVGESILGDLREEFATDLLRTSPLRARLTYWRKASSLLTRYALSPGSGTRGTGDPGNNQEGLLMNAIWHDIRQALRLLVRRPGLTLVAILSLGLGIGANTAIFSLVNTILLRPLPYPDSQELVELFRIDERVTGLNPTVELVSGLWAVPYEVHLDWMTGGRVFAAGGGYAPVLLSLQEGDDHEDIRGATMASGAFQALRTPPYLGRTLLPEDDAVGAPPVAVLSYELWETRFGEDPTILGREIRLDDTLYTVVGVMPPRFGFPDTQYRMWVSFTDDQKTSPTRNAGYMRVVARLAPGISVDQARREMDQFSIRNGELHPEEAEHRVGMFPLKALIIGGNGTGLWILLGAVALVLLIACSNIAGLFLVRATERRREIGVRRALGAGGGRIVFQQVSESLILSILGALVGWWLAVVGLEPLLSLMPSALPRIGEMRIDGTLLITAMGFALFTGVVTGILPALKAADTPITTVLREGGRGSAGGRGTNRVQSILVVSQVALAFVLLTGAGLFIRSMTRLLSVDPGFDTETLALATVSFPPDVEVWEDAMVHFRELEGRLRALPGVVEVGAAEQMPFSGGFSAPPVSVETSDGIHELAVNFPSVTPSYFATMGIPLLEGRSLSLEDLADSEPVAVVSRRLAEQMAPEGSPLGLRIRLNAPGDSIWRTVVGVAEDVRFRLNREPRAIAYVPMEQSPAYMRNWVIRSASDPAALFPAIQQTRTEMDPEGTTTLRRMEENIHGSYAVVSARFSVILLGGLAGLAAFLALFGVYGVLAYLVQLRSKEIGIQIALGADKKEVLGQILKRGLILGGLGLVLGLGLALGLGRFAESQLFGVQAWDPGSLGAAAGLLLAATVAASVLPARRAAAVDPVQVLKGE